MSTHEWDTRSLEERLMRTEARLEDARIRINALEQDLAQRDAKLYDERMKTFTLECVVAQQAKDNALLGEMCDRAIARNIARVVAEGTPGPGVTLHGMASKWLPGPSGLDENDIIGFA